MLNLKIDGKDVCIPLLTDVEVPLHRKLGTAEGPDVNYCLYLALRNVKNFAERVTGYRIVDPTTIKKAAQEAGLRDEIRTAVEFYVKPQ